jgi:phosphoglycolate phosphatase-like HAD superfamily hydrolase
MSGLASWNERAARAAIEAYVATVTSDGPDFVPPDGRVAVFDNDGTLWCEKPMPVQLDYTVRRFEEMAEADASLRDTQPWKAAYEQDLEWMGTAMVKHYHGDDSDLASLMAAVPRALEGLSVDQYAEDVRRFIHEAVHPTLGRTYAMCAYAPMVELLQYLASHGFTNYIASGGDRDFMRPFADELYGIPPERVIGSSQQVEYRELEDGTDVLYKSAMDVFDDGPEKPVRIWSRIGRRPVVAGGNSNGDIPMLRFARAPGRPALRLLILHDDADREFDYTAGAEDALTRAAERDWTVVSIKDDWSRVFAEQ